MTQFLDPQTAEFLRHCGKEASRKAHYGCGARTEADRALGLRCGEAATARGLSCVQVAKVVGCAHSIVGLFFRGKRRTRYATEIAKAVGVQL